jgi:serine/threonine protein kinase/WD40 repeat protein
MTNPESRTRWTTPGDDARLEAIIETAVDNLAAGVPVDVDALAAAHPEFAERLRELLPMVLTMADLGGALQDADPIADGIDHRGGQRTLGDFRILRELGRGGMGTVFEAEQRSMGRRVALKVLPFAALANEKSLQRFKNEVRAAAALDHPHIVSVYSVGEERGVHFYAMQLIRGQTLAEFIETLRAGRTVAPPGAPAALREWAPATIDAAACPPSTQPIPQGRSSSAVESRSVADHFRLAARLGIQAAEALQHAHDQGVLHRDVKPGNLLLDRDGKLSITDFGLARIEADAGLTMTGDLLGTLRYMAPEQVLGKPVVIDHRADVYSLGASLYELLTLEPAFGESNRAELLKKIALDEPRRLQRIDRRIPAELESIVLKAMAKEPQDRYQSAQLMADDLRAFVEHRPIKARPASVHDRLRKWTRRHQTMVVVLALTLSALSVVLAASMYLVNRARASAVAALAQSAESASQLADKLYDADVSLAYQFWEKGWSREVPALLARHRPAQGEIDRRGYEWHVLHSLAREPEPLVLVGHHGPVNEVAVFPGGRRLASVGNDGTLRFWDARTGALLTTLDVGADPLYSVAISPDGRRAAVGSKAVFLCDLERDNEVVEIFRGEHNAESLAFSPDGAQLAIGFRYHEVCMISREGAVLNRRPCDSRIESLEFLPQSRQLLVPNRSSGPDPRGIVQLWRQDLAKVEAVIDAPATSSFTIARPSPCGRYIAAAARYGAKLGFLSVATRKTIAVLPPYRDQATDVCFAPDSSAVAAAYRDGVIQYVPVGGEDVTSFWIDDRIRTLGAHRGPVNAVRFLAASRFATCGDDGLVKIWDLGGIGGIVGTEANRIAHAPAVAISISPDGERIVAVTPRETLLLDGDNGQELFRQPHPEITWAQAVWSSQSDRVAVWHGFNNDVTIRKSDGQVAVVIPNSVETNHVSFSSDGRRVAIIGENLVRLANAQHGKTIAQRQLPHLGLAVAFANQSDALACGGRFGEIILTSADLGRLKRSLPCESDVTRLEFSPNDSVLASGHSDGVIRIWDVASGEPLGEIVGHDGRINSLTFTRDGRALLSSAHDSTIRIASIAEYRSFGVVYRRPSAARLECRATLSSANDRMAAFVQRTNANQPTFLLWNFNRHDAE